MSLQTKHLYEFGGFVLDAPGGILLRQGQYVPVTPKALETLVVLVERNGRVVAKEELLREIWPDTFVEEATLAKNVSTLRKILGDSETHRYIETIPKRGYRFVAEVRVLDEAPVRTPAVEIQVVAAVPPPEPVTIPSPSPVRSRYWLPLAAVLAIACAAGAWKWLANPVAPEPSSSLKNIPLTSYSGRQSQVSFSPDGKRIAFVWEGPAQDGSHIYVKSTEGEATRQLTFGPGLDSKPAWSPDGRSLAFFRTTPNSRTWHLIAAEGGTERRLAEVALDFDAGSATSPYFAPGGDSVAIVDRSAPGEPPAIFAVSIQGGQRLRLTAPPSGTPGDLYPAYSPDGKRLAFVRNSRFAAADLYVTTLGSKELQRLTFDGLPIDGLAWTANAKEIVFSSRRGGSLQSLWRISASGGTPQSVSPTAAALTSPAIWPKGDRLAYTRSSDDMNIWSFTLDAAGRIAARTPLIASTFRDSDPDYSPDGAKIVFVSGRAGNFGIWVCDSDGANPRLLFDGGPYVSGSPRWSPDGKWILFDSRSVDPATKGSPFVGVIDAEGRNFRTVTSVAQGGWAPNWSRDGRSVYFVSARSGSVNLWKVPFAGGAEVPVTQNGALEGVETPDGKYLVYRRRPGTPGFWRIPLDGGAETLVPGTGGVSTSRSWRVAGKGIYFATAAPGGSRIHFIDLISGNIREIAALDRTLDPIIPGLAVAPDGGRLLFAQFDQRGSNIMMVDGFR